MHYAGNFGIASTTFIGLGLLCSLAVFGTLFAGGSSKASHTPETHHHHGSEGSCGDKTVDAEGRVVNHHGGHKARPNGVAPYLNLVLLVSLSISIVCAIVAQFYGILAFVQPASNNGDFNISSGNSEHHDPWVEGRALTTFVTLAWGFAAAAAGLAGALWRVPSFERV